MFKEYKEYISFLEMDKSPNTIILYRRVIDEFVTFFEIKSVEYIEGISLSDYREFQKELLKTLSPKSVNLYLTSLKVFHKFLIQNEYIENDKINLIKNLKESKKPVFVLTDDEVDALLSCATKDEKIMILVMRYTGLRREEMANVKVSDIQDGRLLVHGKGDKEVLIPIEKTVLEKIERYLGSRKDTSQYLLVGKGTHDGITGIAVGARIKAIGRKAFEKNLISENTLKNLSAHTLRKTFVTGVAKQYGDAAAQSAARHESMATTKECYIARNPVLNEQFFMNPERL